MKKVVLISLLAFGCGKDDKKSNPEEAATKKQVYSMTVPTDAELPACGEDNKSQLVYVKASGVLKSCEAGKWEAVTLTQAADKPTRNFACSGVIKNDTLNKSLQVAAGIRVVTMTSGLNIYVPGIMYTTKEGYSTMHSMTYVRHKEELTAVEVYATYDWIFTVQDKKVTVSEPTLKISQELTDCTSKVD
jgi:hypothetical protein